MNKQENEIEIRSMTDDDDKNQISRIYEKSWRYFYRGIIPQDYLDAIPKGHWVQVLCIPEWTTLLCVENGKYIGTSSFCPSRFEQYPDSGEIISLYFLPDYIGQGYGRKLLQAVLDKLHQQGFQEIFLWVLEENLRARQFYEGLGFSCTDDYLEDAIGGKALREVRYVYKYQ